MTMSFILASLFLIMMGGVISLLLHRYALRGGAGLIMAGCLAGFVGAAKALWVGGLIVFELPWAVPSGALLLTVDPIASFFLIPACFICFLATWYGAGYMQEEKPDAAMGWQWFCFSLLIGSMILVFVAAHALVFLVAWELMSLSAFFLVLFSHKLKSSRDAAWFFLVASQLGTAFLLVMFLRMGLAVSSFAFADFCRLPAVLTPSALGVLFLLGLIGFGVKAGVIPLHVWLPEAHPAAPSHVSAVMSAVMIKTGIYGLVRVLQFLGPGETWWGILLIVAGVVSGVLGVLLALAQHDLKRLLAYSSVENIGIIVTGLGAGVLGRALHIPEMAWLGFAGAFLHILNHSLFKGGLFLGAGAVYHASGTREMDHLGGLLKRMPVTGTAFMILSAAIAGLPPCNGFISEFLIYMACLYGFLSATPGSAWTSPVILALPVIGGLAMICFTKAFGVIFLGEPRTEQATHAHEVCFSMRVPLSILAGSCLGVGLAAPILLLFLLDPASLLAGVLPAHSLLQMMRMVPVLAMVSGVFSILLLLGGCLLLVRRILLRHRFVQSGLTWDCGYARPSVSMQYTASSFVQPLLALIGPALRIRRQQKLIRGIFPSQAAFETQAPDLIREEFYGPIFSAARMILSKTRRLQGGRIQLYVLYILLTLLILLFWQVRS